MVVTLKGDDDEQHGATKLHYSKMKPHGMLFKAEMICALLNTKIDVWPAEAIDSSKAFKWQTRRTIKNPEKMGCLTGDCPHESQSECDFAVKRWADENAPHSVGQIIYAQETWGWNYGPMGVLSKDCCLTYRVDSVQQPFDGREWVNKRGKFPTGEGKWKPSIFMEPWMSRVWLVVKHVRVERVNHISEADAQAEGVNFSIGTGVIAGEKCFQFTTNTGYSRFATHAYEDLFDSINGKGSFKRGDWCLIYDLQRISRPT